MSRHEESRVFLPPLLKNHTHPADAMWCAPLLERTIPVRNGKDCHFHWLRYVKKERDKQLSL